MSFRRLKSVDENCGFAAVDKPPRKFSRDFFAEHVGFGQLSALVQICESPQNLVLNRG